VAVELLALVSALAFAGVGATVGVKLLWLARRTRALPERLVGLSLFLLSGVAWPLLLTVSLATSLPSAALRAAWCVASLAMCAGWSGVFLFTWQVFRPGPGWARQLALLGIVVECGAGLAGVIRALTLDELAALRTPSPSGLVLLLGAEAVYAWATVESIRYRALLVRRIPLGLADPVVANRFGLWAWTCAFGFGSLLPAVLAQLGGGDPNSATSRLVVGVLGLLSSVTLYFAFLPPAAYERFLRQNAPSPGPIEGP
jgi:hypothetical protein